MNKKENKYKLVIVDGDSLCYLGNSKSIEEDIQKIRDRIDMILESTSADFFCIYISKGNYFRKNIFDGYKLNRKNSIPPKYSRCLKEFLISEYDANYIAGCEADDGVAWLFNKKMYYVKLTDHFIVSDSIENALEYEEIDNVLAAIDKDVLSSIPGKHFNYTYKLEDKTNPDSIIKGWWVETSESQARGFKLGQMIFGDAGDSVVGLAGKGEKYWEKMCLAGKVTINHILDEYISQHGTSQGIYEFQKNYRLLHLLDCDSDFIQEIGTIPTIPKINVVNKQEIIEYE